RAERLNIGISEFGNESELNPDASNLPRVLFNLFGESPGRYQKFISHVSTIFPNIKYISVAGGRQSGTLEIRVWMNDLERSDLSVSLSECGTGVGQVLAILYVVMTIGAGTVVVDEPNSFLHPGASRKLIRILQEYDRHQYIISTHSPEVI